MILLKTSRKIAEIANFGCHFLRIRRKYHQKVPQLIALESNRKTMKSASGKLIALGSEPPRRECPPSPCPPYAAR